MAISVKIDTEDAPSIFKMLGLAAPDGQDDSGNPPPIDPSIAGAPDPDVTDAGSSQQSVPTKLGRLQQIIQSSQGNTDSPSMTDQNTSPSVPNPPPIDPSLAGAPDPSAMPGDVQGPPAPAPQQPRSLEDILTSPTATGSIVPRDMSNMPDVGSGVTPDVGLASWAERHPVLSKMLGLAIGGAQGAATGAGSMTFGEGYQKAQELPLDLSAKKLGIEHTQASIDQMKSQVTLPNGLTVPFALAQKLYPTLVTEQGKNGRNTASIDSRESIAADKNAIALRAKGLKANPDNPNGPPIPLTRDEMSETEQATVDLKQSQSDAADARADLDRQKNDPNSAAYKAAMGRLAVANKNAQTAAGRLGLEKDTFNANYFGTGPNGQALPGAPTDDNGNPIGTRVANAGAASADRLKRGDLAANAIHNLNNIQAIIDRRPDLLGPIAGRYTSFVDMMGSDDPDIAALGVEGHNYGLASNGAHGVRSQQSVAATEQELLNHFKRGQTGATGAIDAAKDSLNDFVLDQKLGKRARPSGNSTSTPAQPQATHIYNPATGTIAPVK